MAAGAAASVSAYAPAAHKRRRLDRHVSDLGAITDVLLDAVSAAADRGAWWSSDSTDATTVELWARMVTESLEHRKEAAGPLGSEYVLFPRRLALLLVDGYFMRMDNGCAELPNTASLLEALARFDVANDEDLRSPASDLPQLTRSYSSALYKGFRSRRARARFAIASAAGIEKTRRETMLEELSMTVLDEEFSAAVSAARTLFSAASNKEKLTYCLENPGMLQLAR